MSPIRPENRNRYPKDWRKISQRIRFERAQGRCECEGECGRGTHNGRCPNLNGQPAYSTGSKVVLTVAHLNHTPENCHDDNLRAMCQGCHLHYDRDHHRETAAATRRTAIENAGQLTLEPQPRRIQRQRTPGWRKPAGAKYVGRGTQWGNPYAIKQCGPTHAVIDTHTNGAIFGSKNQTEAHQTAVTWYRAWLTSQPDLHAAARQQLAGRDLLCWCPPELPCHADVLLEIANRPAA